LTAAPTPTSQRYKLVIAYRGTHYHGWQTQEHDVTRVQLPTIQALCRAAVMDVVGHPVDLCGSSRTDSGVHAKGQVAHFDTHMTQIPPDGLRRAVNARLPADILVRSVTPVATTFHAIRDTVRKRYQYLVWNAADKPVFHSDLAFHRWQPMDVARMRDAAARLVGTHDFNAFAKPGHGRSNTVRTLYACDVTRRGPRLVIGVCGSGFLWNTVRILSGTLIEVGIGRTPPEAIDAMLASRDRRTAGPTAPACGLYLQWIEHQGEAPAASGAA
jgi:tRNA pseudouridine38-40 synthase